MNQDPQNHLCYVEQLHGWMPSYHVQLEAHDHCPVCHAPEQIQDRAWSAYGMEKNADRALRSLRQSGVGGLDAKVVATHFRSHNYRQPQAPPATPRQIQKAVSKIPDAHGRIPKILQALSRSGTLSQNQIIRLFFYPDTSSKASAEAAAARLLARMRFCHLIYPVRPDAQFGPETYYALGAWALPLLAEHDPDTPTPLPLAYREEMPLYQLQDQSSAAEMFVYMRAGLYPRNRRERIVEVYGKPTPMHMNPDAWWGARSLLFSDPAGKTQWRPDGFATLSVNDGRKQQFQMPMFLDGDCGMLGVDQVVDHLMNYIQLSGSGILASRFPQFDVPGFQIPLLLHTTTSARATRILEELEGRVSGLDQPLPMILVVDQETFLSGLWEADAWRVLGVSEDLGMNLAELLLVASRPLVARQKLTHWRSRVRMNHNAGLPRPIRLPRWINLDGASPDYALAGS